MGTLLRSVFDAEPRSRYLDRFGWLLVLTYLSIAAQMFVDINRQFAGVGQELGNLLAQTLSTAMLVLALYACGVSRRWRIGLMVFAAVGLASRVFVISLEIVNDQRFPVTPYDAPWGSLVLMTLTFGFVSHRLAQHRRVTASTLLAAVTAYLLIPLIFYYAFLVADAAQSGPFFNQRLSGTDFMYFSLTTVTTLGYGEPTPRTDVGQWLATTEALVGQLYLVVVVALIVGLMASRWTADKQPDADGSHR
jgi:hypothetical protein